MNSEADPHAAARARALLQAALEASADALLVTDESGRPEAANRHYLALFGLAPEQLAAHAPVAAADTRDCVELADGRLVERLSEPVSLAGRRIGRIWRYRELARADSATAPPLAEAARALRLKDELISNLSHALRTPLGAILGWAKALQLKRADPATIERGLEAIARNAALQAQLLDELLDADRVLSDRVLLESKPIDLAALVAVAIESATPSAQAKGLRLKPGIEPLGGPVAGDADRLRQVVASLLANAVRYTPRGGCIEVLLRSAGGRVELVVRDEGSGIEAARLPRVFDRHDPDDPSSVRSRSGLGLALPVARRLIELHGGSIEAASAGPGTGATFTVRLPLAPA
ncbi:MAG: HAMP domain-containing sensor histidine kinase [Caldimonas sp.]